MQQYITQMYVFSKCLLYQITIYKDIILILEFKLIWKQLKKSVSALKKI